MSSEEAHESSARWRGPAGTRFNRLSPRSSLMLASSGLLILVIFLIDTLSTLEGAVAVLYVVAVLLAARTGRRRDLIVATSCVIVLTLTAYLTTHGMNQMGSPTMRALVSLAAIFIIALLALQNQSAMKTLSAQARLLDLSHDMIFVRDREGRITFWNRTAEETYGWPADEALGRIADDLLQTSYPQPRATVEAVLIEQGFWNGFVEQKTKAGDTLVLDSRWVLQLDRTGRPADVLETHTNVTDRKQAQDALLHAQAELAHAARVATLGELTATIAHEVNQPLMAVVTNGEAGLRWLRRETPDLKEVEDAVERIVSEGRRADEVVKRIRGFLSKGSAQRDLLDVMTILEDAARLLDHEFSRALIELRIDVEPGLPPIVGDRIQLQQVLVNLMVNASQAMAGQSQQRLLSITSRQFGTDKIAIIVSDSGPGVAASQIEPLFDAFYTTKPQGMGLGLAICKSTVEAHGGHLSLISKPGEGASFQLTLAIAPHGNVT